MRERVILRAVGVQQAGLQRVRGAGDPQRRWRPAAEALGSLVLHSRTWGRAALREDTALPQKAALLAQASTLAIVMLIGRSGGERASRQRSERLWELDGPTWNEKIAAPS